MEPVLKNSCLLNREIAAKSYVRLLLPRSCILILTGLIVLGIAVRHTVLDLRQHYGLRLLFLVLEYGLGILAIYLGLSFPRRTANQVFRRVKEQYRADEYERTNSFLPQEIRSESSVSSDCIHLSYDKVVRITKWKGHIFLHTSAQMLYMLDCARFENGTEADFWRLMNEKCPDAVPRKHRA